MSNKDQGALIARDSISVLFGMAAHTGNRRLLLFTASRCRSNLLGWLICTTGLGTIDYLIVEKTRVLEGD